MNELSHYDVVSGTWTNIEGEVREVGNKKEIIQKLLNDSIRRRDRCQIQTQVKESVVDEELNVHIRELMINIAQRERAGFTRLRDILWGKRNAND